MIRDAKPSDAQAVADIYNHYIRHTIVTFEVDEVTESEMATRIADVQNSYPWLVLEDQGTVIGYAYAARWHHRCAYQHTAESTIYLHPEHTRQGQGTKLYTALLDRIAALPIHVIIAGIALPNDASVAAHEKFGFEQVAHFKQIGRKLGRWIDVGYWQKTSD